MSTQHRTESTPDRRRTTTVLQFPARPGRQAATHPTEDLDVLCEVAEVFERLAARSITPSLRGELANVIAAIGHHTGRTPVQEIRA